MIPLLLLICLAFTTFAAEPELRREDLPRLPALEPAEALKSFQVKPGFRLELVAAEPLVVDPIALCFDEDGRLFVVEMRDYSERRDERLGRIRLLEDLNGDGRMDKSTIFAENLPWPTALFWSRGGLIVISTPDVFYFRDENQDGIADRKQTLFTGFGSRADRLNMQQLPNSLNWSLDNRIHGANGGNPGVVTNLANSTNTIELRGQDFSIDPLTWTIRTESGGAQHGLTFDSAGRRFVCSNSSHILQVMLEQAVLAARPDFSWPPALLEIAADGGSAEVFRISPEEPWRVIRTKWRISGLAVGPIEGGGRASGYFTSATGVTIYKGDALGEEFQGNAFVGDCGSNLIHRKKIRPNGVPLLAERPPGEERTEFIASRDTWFRPVQFANAPDGALYIADMYREVIEHPWSLPPNLKKLIDLNSGNDRGRIYRVVPDNFQQRPLPKLSKATTAELVAHLQHPNGWHRETASRLLHERQDKKNLPALRNLLKSSTNHWGRLHALWALAGLNSLQIDDLRPALADPHPDLHENAVRALAHIPNLQPATIESLLTPLLNTASPRVRFQIGCSLATHPQFASLHLLAATLKTSTTDWERTPALAASANQSLAVLEKLQELGDTPHSLSRDLLKLTARRANSTELPRLAAAISKLAPNPTDRTPLLAAVANELTARRLDPAPILGHETEPLLRDISNRLAQKQSVTPDELRLLAQLQPNPAPLIQALLSQHSELHPPALETLARLKTAAAAEALFAIWPQLLPARRQHAAELFAREPAQLHALFTAIENGQVAPLEIPVTLRVTLRSHANETLRALALKHFGPAPTTSRTEALAKFANSTSLPGRSDAGQKIYLERCASCHRLNGAGTAVGPDLETVRTAGRDALLANIIDPNREIAARYLGYEIEVADEEPISGIIATESAAEITLRAANGLERTVPRARILRLRSTGKSIMPEGLEEGLDAQGFADLLEFILGSR